MRRFSVPVILFILLAIGVSCSGGGTNPAMPDFNGDPSITESDQNPGTMNSLIPDGSDRQAEEGTEGLIDPELTDSNEHPLQGQPIQGSHALWGLYQFSIDPDANDLEIVPLRAATLHLNALKFLEPNGQYGLVQLDGGLAWNPDKTVLDLDLKVIHPFSGLDKFSGFDVRGIVIPKATLSGFSDPDLITSSMTDMRLLNPDGYTRWWNPTEFPGNTIFSYVDGALGQDDAVWDFESTLNGYKYFSNALGLNDEVYLQDQLDRGVFRAGTEVTRHYTLAIPTFPSSLIFNYAIDASWEKPANDPPMIPDDFPITANMPEPYAVISNELFNSIYYDENIPEQGGMLQLEIHVYDWQGATPSPTGTVAGVFGEWPGLFDLTEADFIGDQGPYAAYSMTLTPLDGVLSSTDDIEYLIWVESTDGAGYGGILDPSEPLIVGNRFSTAVLPEEPNLPPVIIDGVTGNAGPGLVTETYTVNAMDPNSDPLTYSWTVAPLISGDPGNGDGTIDIDWSLFGLGTHTVECLVSDSVNPDVPATPLEVLVGNTPPVVGAIVGPLDVSAADTAANYTVLASDPDVGQTLSYMWSFVPDGDPEDFSIPGDAGDGSLTIDYSTVAPGLYSINVEVSDGFDPVTGSPVSVTHNNTPPTVGGVEGKTPVYDSDTDELYQAAWSDPDTTQTLSFLWSIVPEGDPEDFLLPSNPDGSINIDWSTYSEGMWDVNVLADDGIDSTAGTKLTVEKIDNLPPVVGEVSGPETVYHTNVDAEYTCPISDPDLDTLTVNWSVVPHGDPADYTIPGTESDPLTVDWSAYVDLGEYDVNVQADDGVNAPVEGTLLVVTIDNTCPDAGDVTGETPVDGYDTAASYSGAFTEPDTTQILGILWSVVPTGDPANFVIPDLGGGTVEIDWSGYTLGLYDVNFQVDDGLCSDEGNPLIVNRENSVPTIGDITGPDPVDCTDVASVYSAPIADPDTFQTLTILWSIVPEGSMPSYVKPDNGDGSVTVDWSTNQVGNYEINVQVDDGVTVVTGTPIVVTRINTPPVMGDVSGPTTVTTADTENYFVDPATTDCDLSQSLIFNWSIVPQGDPANYNIPTGTDSIDIDWSVYGPGVWTVGCEAYDGYDYAIATTLDVTVTLEPCSGSAHTYFGTVLPNDYSMAALSVIARADVSFMESGIGGINGTAVAQVGPSTLGLFDADTTGTPGVPFTYALGMTDSVISIDTDQIEGRIFAVTGNHPNLIKVIDSSIILGNSIIAILDSGDPLITWVAVDVEADGDIWAVRRDATSGVTYELVRWLYDDVDPGNPPYYTIDPVSVLDITTYTGTESDIFDIAINHSENMLYLLEAGPLGQGRMSTYLVQDGFAAAFMGIIGDVIFSQPLDYDESSFTGFAGYADIDVDHVDSSDERCRILIYGRLEDLTSELIRMDSGYNVLDTQTYTSAWPAFAINPDADVNTRNLIMPDAGNLAFWDTPVDW